jgi:hypothetical protein
MYIKQQKKEQTELSHNPTIGGVLYSTLSNQINAHFPLGVLLLL